MANTETPTALSAADLAEIRALFLRQAAGETAHDLGVIESVLAQAGEGQPDPVNFVARAYCFWGRAAVLEHFREVFTQVWRFEPDPNALKIIPLGRDAAHIFAPTQITVGRSEDEATVHAFLVNEIAIRTPAGWRISAIVPVPVK